jgi:hypothetical protein
MPGGEDSAKIGECPEDHSGHLPIFPKWENVTDLVLIV